MPKFRRFIRKRGHHAHTTNGVVTGCMYLTKIGMPHSVTSAVVISFTIHHHHAFVVYLVHSVNHESAMFKSIAKLDQVGSSDFTGFVTELNWTMKTNIKLLQCVSMSAIKPSRHWFLLRFTCKNNISSASSSAVRSKPLQAHSCHNK